MTIYEKPGIWDYFVKVDWSTMELHVTHIQVYCAWRQSALFAITPHPL